MCLFEEPGVRRRMVMVCVSCGRQEAVDITDMDLAQVLRVDISTVCAPCSTTLVHELVPARWYAVYDDGNREAYRGEGHR